MSAVWDSSLGELFRYACFRAKRNLLTQVFVFFSVCACHSPSQAESIGHLESVGCPSVTVTSLKRSVAFYTEVLTFSEVSRSEESGRSFQRLVGIVGARMRVAHLRLGDECLDLTEFVTPKGKPIPSDSASNDVAFQHVAIVVSDMAAAYARLQERGAVHVSTEPQTLPQTNPAAGGISAFYFKDIDGHVLELISFPSGKGQAKWHAPTTKLFLGIDHTAIVVSDTEQSLTFYLDLLGFHITGKSDNSGPEQENLSGVPGAHVRITSLRGPSGIGIELLQYLSPGSGRVIPADTKANDLASWHSTIVIKDLPRVAAGLGSAHGTMVSSTIVHARQVHIRKGKLKPEAEMLILDPDRHEVEVIEQ